MPTPWLEDASSLVDAYRAGVLTPREATQECLDAIAASELNAFCHVDPEAALAEADAADVSRPFGGVPVAVKELEKVEGWPHTYASLPLAGTLADSTSTQVTRLVEAGAVRLGQTTASEVGLVGYTSTKLHGTTRNPYDAARTPGGSSGGTAAAVAGGLAPIGSGSDGGGSIRIPAGYTGLVGLKTSFRRIPFGPMPQMEPLTSTVGCLARSVRDSARWLDVCNGPDGYDPFALPRVEGYERGLGTLPLDGLRVVVAPDLGGTAVVHPQVRAVVEEAAGVLVKAAGLTRTDLDLRLPMLDQRWAIPAMPVLFAGLAPYWPDIRPMLTNEVAAMMDVAAAYDIGLAGLVEPFRLSVIEAWGRIFEQVDLVVCASNPDDPFPAEGPSPVRVGDVDIETWNAGRLTMGANLASLPAISVPAGVSAAGLPVGLQIYAPRHRDDLLLELALVMERERPWPLVAPGAVR